MKFAAILLALGLSAAPPARATHIAADSAQEIVAAVAAAKAGDVVTIGPGSYELPGLKLTAKGDASHKIVLRAARPGTVELRSRAIEFMKISGSDWVVENLDIAGICDNDSDCEHAFHIVGAADRTVIRHNRIRDYNAHIKGNGENGRFPRDVVIEDNMLFDSHPRATDNPIAPVDVVGGSHWVVRGNLIADFGKRLTHPPMVKDDRSYGLFLKGNSERGVIAGNVVACALARPPTPAARGISFGGSITGSAQGLCDQGDDCSTEHRDGVVEGNIVLNCAAEPGIYLYKAARTRILGNIVAATAGILAREEATTAEIDDNRLDGRIWAEYGATVTAHGNQILSAPEAATRFIRPLERPMSVKPGSSLAAAARQIAAYRAYLAALAKR